MGLVKVGQRVKVKSLGIKGTVEYIDHPNLYRDHMYPIQIILDKPYYEPITPNSYMYRTDLGDINKLKSTTHLGSPYRREIKRFLRWLDKL